MIKSDDVVLGNSLVTKAAGNLFTTKNDDVARDLDYSGSLFATLTKHGQDQLRDQESSAPRKFMRNFRET